MPFLLFPLSDAGSSLGGFSPSSAGEGVRGAVGELSLEHSWVLLPESQELRAEAPVITSVARHGALGQPLRAPAGLGLRPLGPGQGPFQPCCPLRSWAPDRISALIAVARPRVPLRPGACSSWGRPRTAGPCGALCPCVCLCCGLRPARPALLRCTRGRPPSPCSLALLAAGLPRAFFL